MTVEPMMCASTVLAMELMVRVPTPAMLVPLPAPSAPTATRSGLEVADTLTEPTGLDRGIGDVGGDGVADAVVADRDAAGLAAQGDRHPAGDGDDERLVGGARETRRRP